MSDQDTTVLTSPESAPKSDALVVAPIRKMPVRLKELELDGDFKDWKFTARMNIPLGALSDFASGDISKTVSALVLVIKDWNFVDEEGALLPKPDEDTIRLMTQDLSAAVIERYMKALSELPKR